MEVIEFKLSVDEDRVYFKVLDFNDEYYVDSATVFESSDEFRILSYSHPELCDNLLYIRGDDEDLDEEECSLIFDSNEAAVKYRNRVLKAFYEWMKSINPNLEMFIDWDVYQF